MYQSVMIGGAARAEETRHYETDAHNTYKKILIIQWLTRRRRPLDNTMRMLPS